MDQKFSVSQFITHQHKTIAPSAATIAMAGPLLETEHI